MFSVGMSHLRILRQGTGWFLRKHKSRLVGSGQRCTAGCNCMARPSTRSLHTWRGPCLYSPDKHFYMLYMQKFPRVLKNSCTPPFLHSAPCHFSCAVHAGGARESTSLQTQCSRKLCPGGAVAPLGQGIHCLSTM